MPEDPEEWEDQPYGGLGVGNWGYQVLRERPKKIVKHPIGFGLPEEVKDDLVSD